MFEQIKQTQKKEINLKLKKSNNSTFVILIFEESNFRNIGRSTFGRSKLWSHPLLFMKWPISPSIFFGDFLSGEFFLGVLFSGYFSSGIFFQGTLFRGLFCRDPSICEISTGPHWQLCAKSINIDCTQLCLHIYCTLEQHLYFHMVQ